MGAVDALEALAGRLAGVVWGGLSGFSVGAAGRRVPQEHDGAEGISRSFACRPLGAGVRIGNEVERAVLRAPIGDHAVGAGERVRLADGGNDNTPAGAL